MTKKTKLVNKHKEDYDVYIGRGSIWGNPYRTGVDGTRNEVIDLYGVYLRECLEDGRIVTINLQIYLNASQRALSDD